MFWIKIKVGHVSFMMSMLHIIVDPKELIGGLRDKFGIFISEEESEEVVKYLDSDNSGDIDFKEFSKKVNFKDL